MGHPLPSYLKQECIQTGQGYTGDQFLVNTEQSWAHRSQSDLLEYIDCHISAIKRHGYFYFITQFTAATIRGQPLINMNKEVRKRIGTPCMPKNLEVLLQPRVVHHPNKTVGNCESRLNLRKCLDSSRGT